MRLRLPAPLTPVTTHRTPSGNSMSASLSASPSAYGSSSGNLDEASARPEIAGRILGRRGQTRRRSVIGNLAPFLAGVGSSRSMT